MSTYAQQLIVETAQFPGFPDQSEVIPPHLRIAQGSRPKFGDDTWDLAALGLAPSQKRHLAVFKFSTIPTKWQYYARRMLMVMLNPTDKLLLESRIYLNQSTPKLKTLKTFFLAFRRFSVWSEERNKPVDLEQWESNNLEEYYEFLKDSFAPSQLYAAENLFTKLENICQALPSFFLFPVPDNTVRRDTQILTKSIEPDDFWSLLHACWSYIDVFSSDILEARDDLRKQQDSFDKLPVVDGYGTVNPLLKQHFENPGAFVPLHVSNSGPGTEGDINWEGISLLVPFRKKGSATIVNPGRRLRHQIVIDAIESGVPLRYGTIDKTPKNIINSNGISVPWCNGFDKSSVRFEITKLRVACFIFISALSMMRLSEAAGLRCGALTTHYGAPAVKAKLYKKHHAAGKTDYWWVSDPVAKAIRIAEAIAEQEGSLFRSPKYPTKTMDHPDEVRRFVEWINSIGPSRGLRTISDTSISTHRLRRTMSIITASQPDGEIALGITLKHNATRALANSVTSGYGAPTPAWEAELRLEEQRAKAAELVSRWSKHKDGDLRISGPGAKTFQELMAHSESIPETPPSTGTARSLRNLLRDPSSRITFGTLNHCLGDPTKAKCLEGLDHDAKEGGPILSECSPATCRNSVITSEHLPLWKAEEKELTTLLKDRHMSDVHRKQLEHRLAETRHVTQSPEFRQ